MGGDNEARRAEAALQAVVVAERLLHRGQVVVGPGDALDGRDLGAVGLHGVHEAGPDGLAVEQDRARTARAVLAAQVGAGEPAASAQEVGQREPGRHGVAAVDAVDLDADRVVVHRPASSTARSQARATATAPTRRR